MVKQKKIKRIPFEPKHIDLIEAREHEATGLLAFGNVTERLTALAHASKDCGTFIADGKIICCAGYLELRPGVIEVWVIPSVHIPKYILEYLRIFKGYMDHLSNDLNYHRIQTSCLDDKLHHRWMKWLGMESEGVMRQYTAKRENFCMFSRVQ